MRFRIRTVRRTGQVSRYPVATFYDDFGGRHLKHLLLVPELMAMSRKVRAVFRNLEYRELLQEQPQGVMDWIQEESGYRERQPKTRKQKAKKTGRPGRPTRLPKAVMDLLNSAGYRVDGSRISRDMGTFFTLEASTVRFRELAPELQELTGSPSVYLEACIKAEHDLKSASRYGISSSFEEMLARRLEGLAEAS